MSRGSKATRFKFISKHTVFHMQARSQRRNKVFFRLECFLAPIMSFTNDLGPQTFCFFKKHIVTTNSKTKA